MLTFDINPCAAGSALIAPCDAEGAQGQEDNELYREVMDDALKKLAPPRDIVDHRDKTHIARPRVIAWVRDLLANRD